MFAHPGLRAFCVICYVFSHGLIFIQEKLGIAQTTKTITGVVLIAVQTSLTAILAILIAVNAIITCCKENPHRKRRKEAGMSGLIQVSLVIEADWCSQRNSIVNLMI